MRVNIINPKYLSDQQLIHEYRSIKMSTAHYEKSSNTKKGIEKSRISERYVLDKGHAYMWYNKFGYIEKRLQLLCSEMDNRKFNCNYRILNYRNIPKEAFRDFEPNEVDRILNVERLMRGISKKPNWYTWNGEKVEDWQEFYDVLLKEGLL